MHWFFLQKISYYNEKFGITHGKCLIIVFISLSVCINKSSLYICHVTSNNSHLVQIICIQAWIVETTHYWAKVLQLYSGNQVRIPASLEVPRQRYSSRGMKKINRSVSISACKIDNLKCAVRYHRGCAT